MQYHTQNTWSTHNNLTGLCRFAQPVATKMSRNKTDTHCFSWSKFSCKATFTAVDSSFSDSKLNKTKAEIYVFSVSVIQEYLYASRHYTCARNLHPHCTTPETDSVWPSPNENKMSWQDFVIRHDSANLAGG